MCHTIYLRVSCAEVEALLAKALTETCVQIATGGFNHSFALCNPVIIDRSKKSFRPLAMKYNVRTVYEKSK